MRKPPKANRLGRFLYAEIMTFTVKLPRELLELDALISQSVREQAFKILVETTEQLIRDSPRGVSPGGSSLATSWSVIPGRGNGLGTITNTADAAYHRIVGRGPGRFTPWGDDSELQKWVAGILGITDPSQRRSVAYLIARRHAAEGSRRFRENRNILGVDVASRSYRPTSIVNRTAEKMSREISVDLRI